MAGLRFWLMTLIAFCAMALPAYAAPLGEEPHIAIRLVAESDTPAPGSDVMLAFVSTPQPGWHGYWKVPGDAGYETRTEWTLTKGASAGPLLYPVPQRLLIAGLMNYVYEGPFVQFATLKLDRSLAPGTKLPVRVKLDYLVCTREVCVPESAELATELTVGDGSIPADRRAQFDAWRKALPRPLGSEAKFALAGGMIRLAIPFPADAAAEDVYFYPLTNKSLAYAAPQKVSREGDALLIETKAAGSPARVEGVLAVGGGRGFAVTAVPGAVPAAIVGTSAGGSGSASTALFAFLGAVLGGLLLNIMPCVFPILSLKALSLARSGTSQTHARAEGLAYTAGVILVCIALGGVLLGLRAAGASAGWAFQLQDPRVILVLLLLVVGIALNLAGLFELAAPKFVNRAAASGSGGAFATGALAAFIATPCTGPFMGAALGAALVLPWFAALLVFAGLGLGLALPFLLLGFVPALRDRLPKPGAWMETFRHILAVPMFLTALALAWVLGRQSGVEGMTLGIAAAMLLGFGLWWSGSRQRRGAGLAWLPALLAAMAALTSLAAIQRAPATAAPATGSAETFSEARLAELRGADKPVFAYFTADWCLTCKVNEKTAIETEAVERAFREVGVAVLVGDWTDGNPALGRFIERHNRAGVPLYLWYPKGASEPTVLPQLLTQSMLVEMAAR